MTAIDDALTQLKTILAGATVTGQPAPLSYVYPSEWQAISNALIDDRFPVFTVEQVVYVPTPWRRKSYGRGLHVWDADIRLYLHRSQMVSHEDIAAAAATQTGWPLAVSTVLYADQTLNGTALNIGARQAQAPDLFTYRIGQMVWEGTNYWGMAFSLSISQVHAQVMTA